MWYKNNDEVLKELNTSLNGLSEDIVRERISLNGLNKLPKEKQKSIVMIFFEQFLNPIVFILIIAAILSLIIGEYLDFIFILIVIGLDAILGTVQEWRAFKSASSLQELIKVTCKVIRNGKEKRIDAENVVVGDIISLEPGDKVCADLRLISTYNLAIDESILTGESIARNKNSYILEKETILQERDNIAFAGTSILRGRAIGVVIKTGLNTEIGKIASKVIGFKNEKSPLVIRMEKFTKQIGIIAAIVALIITFILYLKGYAPREIFFAVVALSVSAIPEGLPVALTLSLSIASNRMSKKNVIVKKLNSVESLGSCTVIASDKTGTLTLNEQTAKIIVLPNDNKYEVTGVGYNCNGKVTKNIETENIGLMGILNNEAFLDKDGNHYGDSIDVAFLALGYKLGITEKKYEILGSIPYESENKYSAVFYKNEGIYCTMKGSVEIVLNFCDKMGLSKKEKINYKKILEQNEELSKKGYRVIAVAVGENKKFEKKEVYDNSDIPKMTFLGLVGFIDPIRKEAISSIKECYNAGIKVVMITGDHPLTAYAIANELGIASSYDEVVTNSDIEKYLGLGDDAFDEYIKNKKVFTRVTPIQKLEIVNSYKRLGEFIAVTGDGVNDAPAIKAANIGIAMGSGTDVAKEAATMIITDDNFTSIVLGIEEGRNAYSNVRKVIYMLLSCGFAEILFFLLAILFDYPMPLVAIQLLWLNLVTDGLQDVALSFEKGTKDVMKAKPRNPKEKIFNPLLIKEVLLSGLFIGLIVYGLWVYLIDYKSFDITKARGYVLLLMVFMQDIHVLNCRSEDKSIFNLPFKNNYFVIVTIIMSLLLQIMVMEVGIFGKILKVESMPWDALFEIFIMSLPVLIVMEVFKMIRKHKKKV